MKVSCRLSIFIIVATLIACNSKKETPDQTTIASDSVPPTTVSARPVHWGYDDKVGPAMWKSLSPVYAACGDGRSQSPIDIKISAKAGQTNWVFNYNTTSLKIAHHQHVDDILDNGHTIQITVEEGSTFTLDDKTYHLKQFHFHTPSEHTVEGKHLPMEMHWVHQSDDGGFGVIGILFEEGRANENLTKIIEHLPSLPGESSHFTEVKLDLAVHIPENISAYHYTGSFTTPPCTENVAWLVLQNKFTMSADQIKAFSSRLNNNNRPVQPLNDRVVNIEKIK
jgi:carbonic anhydrase